MKQTEGKKVKITITPEAAKYLGVEDLVTKKERKCYCMCNPFQEKPYMSDRNMTGCKHCEKEKCTCTFNHKPPRHDYQCPYYSDSPLPTESPVPSPVGASRTSRGEEEEKRIAQIVMEHSTDVFNGGCLDGDIKDLLAKERQKVVEEIIKALEKGFSKGHGGGNWRRLYIQVIAALKQKYLPQRGEGK